MRYRALGNTGLTISEAGFGAWGLGGKQWQGVSANDSEDALRRALDLGVNFIDTALAYGDGDSERLVGRVLRHTTSPVVVATKVPPLNGVWPAASFSLIEEVFPSRHIIKSTEDSLRNLRVDSIDLQQLHVWNPRWTYQEEWRRAFDELKQAGKIRFIGVSLTEHDPDSGLELVRSGLVDSFQVLYNIFDPSAADKLFPLTMEEGVGIIARVPLDEGGLTGLITERTVFAADDFRAGYFRGERRRDLVERVAALQYDLRDHPGDLADTAIRFCLSHPAVSTVIPGMRRVQHVERNVRAVECGPLNTVILELLRAHAWDRNFYI
jgi:aryl-alcohol dehydrogenase-like predicted oxidoreductase